MKQPTRFRSHAVESPRENCETNQPVQPGDDRTGRNLMPDFDQARFEEVVDNKHEGGTDGGGEGNGDDDGDENWNGNSSEETKDESYATEEEDTLDTGSSIPNEEPALTRQTHREPSQATRRNHRQRSPTLQTVIDMAAIRDMVRKGVARELAEINAEKGAGRDPNLGVDEGPLSKRIYRASMADFKYPTTLPNFQGSGDTQDPHNFVHSFQERLRLLGATDPIMCRVFTTCLSGEAWDWYMGLPRGSVKKFKHLARAFLERYTVIKPPQITCEMLLDVLQEPGERTRTFVNRFIQKSRKI